MRIDRSERQTIATDRRSGGSVWDAGAEAMGTDRHPRSCPPDDARAPATTRACESPDEIEDRGEHALPLVGHDQQPIRYDDPAGDAREPVVDSGGG